MAINHTPFAGSGVLKAPPGVLKAPQWRWFAHNNTTRPAHWGGVAGAAQTRGQAHNQTRQKQPRGSDREPQVSSEDRLKLRPRPLREYSPWGGHRGRLAITLQVCLARTGTPRLVDITAVMLTNEGPRPLENNYTLATGSGTTFPGGTTTGSGGGGGKCSTNHNGVQY
jgi:hypothetical protein